MVDNKNRDIKVGDRVRTIMDIPSVNGMLYENQIVTIDGVKDKKIRVKCSLGKLWWVEPSHVSCSFL